MIADALRQRLRRPGGHGRQRRCRRVKAFLEAEAYPGPSLIIAYSHCIAHGIDMSTAMSQQKEAVASGYWPLYRYDPRLAGDGQAPVPPRQPQADDPARGVRHEGGAVRHAGPDRPGAVRAAARRWRSATSTSAGGSTSRWPASSASVPDRMDTEEVKSMSVDLPDHATWASSCEPAGGVGLAR